MQKNTKLAFFFSKQSRKSNLWLRGRGWCLLPKQTIRLRHGSILFISVEVHENKNVGGGFSNTGKRYKLRTNPDPITATFFVFFNYSSWCFGLFHVYVSFLFQPTWAASFVLEVVMISLHVMVCVFLQRLFQSKIEQSFISFSLFDSPTWLASLFWILQIQPCKEKPRKKEKEKENIISLSGILVFLFILFFSLFSFSFLYNWCHMGFPQVSLFDSLYLVCTKHGRLARISQLLMQLHGHFVLCSSTFWVTLFAFVLVGSTHFNSIQ